MVIMEQFNPSNPNVDVTNLTEEDVDTAKLRLNLIVEELDEMFEALDNVTTELNLGSVSRTAMIDEIRNLSDFTFSDEQ